jgi:hypothetical protein
MIQHPWRAFFAWALVACALLVWNYDWVWQGSRYYLHGHATRAAFSILALGAATLFAAESVRRSRFPGYALRAFAGVWAVKRWILVVLVALALCLVAFYLPRPKAKSRFEENAPSPAAKSVGSEWDVISSGPLDAPEDLLKSAPPLPPDFKPLPPTSGQSKKTSR